MLARGGDHAAANRKYLARTGEGEDPWRRSNADPRYAFALIDREPQREAIMSVLGDSPNATTLRGRKLIFVVPGHDDDALMLLMDRLDVELGGVESLPPWPPAWRRDALASERRRTLMRDIHRDTAGARARIAVVRWAFFHDKWRQNASENALNARILIETLLDGSDEPALPAVFFLIFSGVSRTRKKAGDSCQISNFVKDMRDVHEGQNQIIFLPPPELIYREDIIKWSSQLGRLCKDPSKARELRDEGLRRIGDDGSSLQKLSEDLLPLVKQVLSRPRAGARGTP